MDAGHREPPIKDPKRIDLTDPREVTAWCLLFQLDEGDLRTAVEAVGSMSAAVAVYINTRGRRGTQRQTGEIGRPFERKEARGD
jgi:hypothetical protein